MKVGRIICCFFVLAACLAAFVPAAVSAQTERVEIAADYSRLQGVVTDTFTFQLNLTYYGASTRDFALKITAPSGWDTYCIPPYQEGMKISSITVEPTTSSDTNTAYVSLQAKAPSWPIPGPGEYPIKLEAISGSITGSINLTVVITASFAMQMAPVSGLYNTSARANQGTVYSVELTNTGTAPITNINFYSDKAQGWKVGVGPVARIDSLESGGQQTIDLTIIPPAKTIVGDYYITFWAEAAQVSSNLQIRVTVEAPTLGGIIGLIMIVVAAGGLGFIYVRFRRR